MPFINARTGLEDVYAIARPGQSDALINLYTTTRVQGAEANLVGNLVAQPGVKIHAIAGYRFLQVNEGLRLESRWMQNPTPESGFTQTLGMTADQFDGRNEFHGGQVGLVGDFHRGPFYVEVVGKVAVGTNFQVVNVSGETHLITAASPVPLYRSYYGGVYSQPTNIGRMTQTAFAVVPEAILKMGLKYGDVWVLAAKGDATPSVGHAIDHVGWRVADLDQTLAALKARNIKVLQGPTALTLATGVVHFSFIEDPAGTKIEIVQR